MRKRSIEGCIRELIDRHFKPSDVDMIFGSIPMNITIHNAILAAQEITFRNRQSGGTLALAQMRYKLYSQMIIESKPISQTFINQTTSIKI